MQMKQTILSFIELINAHDVHGIVALMSDDYVFVNSSGDRFRGREFMRDTWSEQFRLHPDFHIRVQRVIADDEAVAVFGISEGTYSPDGLLRAENRWSVPAAFLGIARGGKLTYWEAYSDASIIYDLVAARTAAASVAKR
jgi:limonene-1,2-epoxide hydrolase